ncbi:MAG: RHS repeat protein, partial [bacterium]
MTRRLSRLFSAPMHLVVVGLIGFAPWVTAAEKITPRMPAAAERIMPRMSAVAASGQPAGRGWFNVNPAPVTPEEAEAAIQARGSARFDSPIRAQSESVAANFGALDSPASIAELARALKNSPDLMYEYVRNNIEFYPVWGVQKGAVGAIVDQKGTAFDQALLLRDLARQAGFAADLVRGTIRLTGAQAAAWLGVSAANLCTVADRFSSGYVPLSNLFGSNSPAPCGVLDQIDVGHVWVTINIGGTNYVFDPAYKPRAVRTGINLATVTGYSQASFLTAAQTGATLTTDYVQNMNRTAVRDNLTTYATNLVNHIRSTNPNGALHDVFGGPAEIVPYTGPNLRQSSLPYQTGAAPVVLTEGNAVAANNIDNYKVTLRLQFRGIDRTFNSDAIYGKRLTFSFTAANVPELRLDGVVQATGTAATAGTSYDVTMTVTHRAYASTDINETFSQSIQAGAANVYAVSNGWGPMGSGTLAHYQRKLAEARISGAADGSEVVMGATVALLAAQWIAQTEASRDLADRIGQSLTISHHALGIAGFNGAVYVDLPGKVISIATSDRSDAKRSAAFYSGAQYMSVLESTAVQQVASVAAASTVSLVDKAVASGTRIYNVSSSNYSTVVQPLLASWGCSPQSGILSGGVSQGLRFVMPANCAIAEGSWQGAGYFQ